MKKFLMIAAWVVGSLVVIVVGGGLLLSPRWEVERSRVIAAPPEAIHPHVDDLAKWPAWSPFEKQDPAMTIEIGTPSSGVGARRSWKSESMGNGSQTIVASDPKKGVAFDLQMEGFPVFRGEFAFEPAEGGTKVTWSDRGDVGGNPIHRWFALFSDSLMGETFDKGLADLETAVLTKR
jgi:carbon monoxide dehydrogenase subunit G